MEEYLCYGQRMNRLARPERIAHRLDSRFRLPLIGLRFGWDSVLGLVPGIGDVVTALPSVFMIYEGAKMGARRRVLVRMGTITTLDFVVGSIPFLGDLFDIQFKSHRRNVALLRAKVERRHPVRAA